MLLYFLLDDFEKHEKDLTFYLMSMQNYAESCGISLQTKELKNYW